MSPSHRAVLTERFTIKPTNRWLALRPIRDDVLRGYGTERFAKVQTGPERGGDTLYFTVHTTKRGRSYKLENQISALIRRHGLAVVDDLTSTSDRSKGFIGFRLATCSPETLRAVLEDALALTVRYADSP